MGAGWTDAVPPTQSSKLRQAACACPLLDGDREAWVACRSKRFFPLARRVAGDNDLAQDALQESLIKILEAEHRCRGGSPACAWGRGTVANSAKDNLRSTLRKRRREVPLDQTSDVESRFDDLGASLEREEEEQQLHLVSETVAALPETYRQVLEMRHIPGLSTEETAAQLHTSRNDASVRLHRAVSRLRKQLQARSSGRDRP